MDLRRIAGALCAAGLALGTAHAADADFCFSAPHASNASRADSKTTFTCPVAGNHTVGELAKAGWMPVQMDQLAAPVAGGAKPTTFLVQERLLIVKK